MLYSCLVPSLHVDANLFKVKEALKLNIERNHYLHLVKEKMPEYTARPQTGSSLECRSACVTTIEVTGNSHRGECVGAFWWRPFCVWNAWWVKSATRVLILAARSVNVLMLSGEYPHGIYTHDSWFTYWKESSWLFFLRFYTWND